VVIPYEIAAGRVVVGLMCAHSVRAR
jgi:hypothetical protein